MSLLNPKGLEPENLQSAVAMSIGAGSTCWSDLARAGIFDSTRASDVVDDLVAWVEKYYEPKADELARLAAAHDDAQLTLT